MRGDVGSRFDPHEQGTPVKFRDGPAAVTNVRDRKNFSHRHFNLLAIAVNSFFFG
jgi:hypothetical protein